MESGTAALIDVLTQRNCSIIWFGEEGLGYKTVKILFITPSKDETTKIARIMAKNTVFDFAVEDASQDAYSIEGPIGRAKVLAGALLA